MSDADRQRWEEKYSRMAATAGEPALSSVLRVPRGHFGSLALDLACGRGRHCRTLVERGYRVIAADISGVALRELLRASRDDAQFILPLQADLERWPFAPEVFDLVIQCDFLERSLFTSIKASVRNGGHVLVDTFCGEPHAGDPGPRRSDYRLQPGELREVFADWDVVWSSAQAVRGRDAILARKPDR